MRLRLCTAFVVAAALLAGAGSGGPASANWLTSLTKGAGKAASHPHVNLGALERAAGHLAELPHGTRGALAAHATPEGHWQFVNREGQMFTAGTADEMTRVASALAPDAAHGGKLSLYLSEDSAFANREALQSLPKDAELHLVTKSGAYDLARDASGAASVKIKPNVEIALNEQVDFDDAVNFLTKPFNKSNIRTLAIQPGEAKSLSSAPKLDPASKAPLVDTIDPDTLVSALGSIRGQTAVLVGRIDGNSIVFQPAKGPMVSKSLHDVREAARANDVNLVVLHSDTPRQPGGRNWLWQTFEIGGFSEAISKSTFADFVKALAAKRGPMQIAASGDGIGRVRLTAVAEGGGPVESVQSSLAGIVGEVTGEIATQSISAFARDETRDRELDARIIPGIPTHIQFPYFGAIFFGLLSAGVARHWWTLLWAPRVRQADENILLHWLKSLPNLLVYLLVFLPVAGLPAFTWHALTSFWNMVTMPFRFIAKLFRRRVEV